MAFKKEKMTVKKIACIGAGYVGGPTMAVIALKCPEIEVTVVDSNQDKINQWNGPIDNLPVFEPGLSDIIVKTRNKNLFFSDNIDKAILDAEIIFMAVNTPTKESGEGAGMACDLKYVKECAQNISKVSKSDKIVVEKSTLPVRTAETIKEILMENSKYNFEVLSNPEFLAEGTAINDLFKSDRVLIGSDPSKSGQEAAQKLVEIYERWIPKNKILKLNVWSAELAKLSSNAMLAQRISSINSLSAICEKTNANIDEVSKAIGLDHRIGKHFLKVSPGFGGSCFKKDILNLVYLCKFYGLDEVAEYWHNVVKINEYQVERIVGKIEDYINENKYELNVSILGWAFKKNTNDSRESASIYVAYKLISKGYNIGIYDPMVSEKKVYEDLLALNSKHQRLKEKQLKENIKVYDDLTTLIGENKILAVLTEWDQFKALKDLDQEYKIFDFRNFIDQEAVTMRL